jgi:hypothetical protein
MWTLSVDSFAAAIPSTKVGTIKVGIDGAVMIFVGTINARVYKNYYHSATSQSLANFSRRTPCAIESFLLQVKNPSGIIPARRA